VTASGPLNTISTSTFRNNTGHSDGGAVFHGGGVMTVLDTSIISNTANFGGGIYTTFGPLTVTSSTITANHAVEAGGGINNTNALTVTSSIITNNRAEKDGGGIATYGGLVMITTSTIAGNSAVTGTGGGLWKNRGTLTSTNTTISNNSTNQRGGGIANIAGGAQPLLLINTTIVDNSAALGGSGIYNVINGSVQMKDTLVANNFGSSNCSGVLTSLGNNLASDGTCTLNQPSDIANVAPWIGQLHNNGGPTPTHALFSVSPAIDHGADCPAVDQRGIARPQGQQCDIGAYEFDGQGQGGIIFLPLIIR
jgi:predicted outer membrane repeat protein